MGCAIATNSTGRELHCVWCCIATCVQNYWGILAAGALQKRPHIAGVLEIPHSVVLLMEASSAYMSLYEKKARQCFPSYKHGVFTWEVGSAHQPNIISSVMNQTTNTHSVHSPITPASHSIKFTSVVERKVKPLFLPAHLAARVCHIESRLPMRNFAGAGVKLQM